MFTSVRGGDLDLYLMNPDGSGVEQLTDAAGYDGGERMRSDVRLGADGRIEDEDETLSEKLAGQSDRGYDLSSWVPTV